MITILLAGGLSLIFTLIGTPRLIKFLTARQYGQFIREDGPKEHLVKRGTPTMGGIVIVLATVLAYFVAHLVRWTTPTYSGVLLLGLMAALGVLGFLDDWAKISQERSLGLTARGKLIGQFLIGGTFAVLALSFPDGRGLRPASQFVSFLRDVPWLYLPFFVAVLWILFLVMAWANAVNLTDGLDGLAAGSATLVFAAFAIVNIWQNNQFCQRVPSNSCYNVRDPLDLAIVAAAITGACFGFLWWNASPARIFMGDTGSLALGGALAGLAVLTRTELLLVILGGLFLVETLSVMVQVGYFKLSDGKRVFRMAPLHHHFEMLGWEQVTVVIRFWIITGICVATGLGVFYAEWVAGA